MFVQAKENATFEVGKDVYDRNSTNFQVFIGMDVSTACIIFLYKQSSIQRVIVFKKLKYP